MFLPMFEGHTAGEIEVVASFHLQYNNVIEKRMFLVPGLKARTDIVAPAAAAAATAAAITTINTFQSHSFLPTPYRHILYLVERPRATPSSV